MMWYDHWVVVLVVVVWGRSGGGTCESGGAVVGL